jgi:hypothetical protein
VEIIVAMPFGIFIFILPLCAGWSDMLSTPSILKYKMF